jgi:hypothetical protein
MKQALAVALLFLTGATARAADLPCGPAEKDTVQLDGLLDDWKDVEGIDAGGRDPNLSFTLKCNVDPTALWLVIEVRDNYFVRTAAGKPGEDHISLKLGAQKMTLFPGDQAAIKDKLVAPIKGMRIAAALQPKGWAVEVGVPLKSIPGWKPGMPNLPFSVEVHDSDSKSALKIERSVDSTGQILFAEGESSLDAFLKESKLKRGDIFFDRPITLGRSAGARLIMAGKYMAAISDGYVYMELPFRDRKDLKEARVIDLAGDRRGALVLQFTERSSSGARDVIAVYRFTERVTRVFAAETGKSQGNSRIVSKVSYAKRGAATDILIEAGSATGFTKENYQESPAEDMIPVLLPWGDDKKARYQFRGDEYLRQ